MDNKYYYELSNTNTGETLLCSTDLPIKSEKLPEVLCLDGYTARQVSKKYFDREYYWNKYMTFQGSYEVMLQVNTKKE